MKTMLKKYINNLAKQQRKLQIWKGNFEVKESNGYMKNTLRNVTSEW